MAQIVYRVTASTSRENQPDQETALSMVKGVETVEVEGDSKPDPHAAQHLAAEYPSPPEDKPYTMTYRGNLGVTVRWDKNIDQSDDVAKTAYRELDALLKSFHNDQGRPTGEVVFDFAATETMHARWLRFIVILSGPYDGVRLINLTEDLHKRIKILTPEQSPEVSAPAKDRCPHGTFPKTTCKHCNRVAERSKASTHIDEQGNFHARNIPATPDE